MEYYWFCIDSKGDSNIYAYFWATTFLHLLFKIGLIYKIQYYLNSKYPLLRQSIHLPKILLLFSKLLSNKNSFIESLYLHCLIWNLEEYTVTETNSKADGEMEIGMAKESLYIRTDRRKLGTGRMVKDKVNCIDMIRMGRLLRRCLRMEWR